ncbi:molybdenum cofactor guanylyltransferase [Herbiconiux liukaitaii]|uniref:molybdenum cofactor guanylyltransferase n=1 Tax=Herbiconiux liukaitaii TaxID=3342799 RepID=UPI0035BB4AFE
MQLDAIVLAGGRSTRLGGSPKALLQVDGRRLVDIAVDAAREAGARRIVVVGPPVDLPPPASPLSTSAMGTVREDPPFGGPAAGIGAGLAALDPPDTDLGDSRYADADADADTGGRAVLVLACDVPAAGGAVGPVLVEAERIAATRARGWCAAAVDPSGARQLLLAVYDAGLLSECVAAHRVAGTLSGLAVRILVAPFAVTEVIVPPGSTADVDTWTDAEALGAVPDSDVPDSVVSDSASHLSAPHPKEHR